MSPNRKTAVALAFAASLGAAHCCAAFAAPQGRDARRESERQYQKGLGAYAQGRRAPALAAFQEALRLDPHNPSARAAVQRIALEDSQSGAARSTPAAQRRPTAASLEEMIDDFLLRQVPRYFRFERTVGDARADQGTLEAMQGRVAQLMCERRLALSRRSAFAKDRELRALVRRLPLVLA